MQLLQILQNGSEHLPPGFRAAFKQAGLDIGQMAGERDILTLTINDVVLQFNVYEAFDRIVVFARILGREMCDLLRPNVQAIEQIKVILRREVDNEDYSRLALSLKEGGQMQYKIAHGSLKAMVPGLEDRTEKDR